MDWLISDSDKIRLVFFQGNEVIQPTFQSCGSTLKWHWSDVENETKSDIGFSTLHNVDTMSVHDVETTLKHKVTQSRNNAAERCYNIDTTLHQPSVDVIYWIKLG